MGDDSRVSPCCFHKEARCSNDRIHVEIPFLQRFTCSVIITINLQALFDNLKNNKQKKSVNQAERT